MWAYTTEQQTPAWKAALLKRKKGTNGAVDDAAAAKKGRAPLMEEWIRRDKIAWPDSAGERVVVWETKEALLDAIRSGNVPKTDRGRTPLLTEELPDLDFWVGKPVSFERPWFRRHLSDLKSATSLVSS